MAAITALHRNTGFTKKMPGVKRDRRKGKVRMELGERASYRFAILSTRQVGQMSSVYLHRFGLTGNTWRVLSIIGYYGPMSATEVCRHGSLEADKVTRAVDILGKKKLVLRRRNAEDRRKVVLSLSARGRRVYDEIERLRYAQERKIMKALEPEELDSLYNILDKLEARADEIFVPADGGKGTRPPGGGRG
jgi:DNA-binding MarR family transcriptional regulator